MKKLEKINKKKAIFLCLVFFVSKITKIAFYIDKMSIKEINTINAIFV